MREAYFSVGEEVILVSESWPNLNGEYTIECKEYRNGRLTISSEILRGWWYSLAGLDDRHLFESALRKKHQPGEFTFEQLISQKVEA